MGKKQRWGKIDVVIARSVREMKWAKSRTVVMGMEERRRFQKYVILLGGCGI